MSQLNFIERNPQKVLEECIAQYENLSGQVLHPATPERVLIDILAYRESLLREAIQDASLQNTVDYARGEFLDALGRLLGVVRLDGESDEAMRMRVRLAPERFAAGTKSAYRFHALSAGARDALVYGYNEKSDVPIGTVRVAITSQTGEPDAALKTTVLNALNDEKVRCVCDVIEIANDVPGEVTPFNVVFEIGVKVSRGYDEDVVCEAVRNRFLAICTERFTGRFGVVISWAEVSRFLFMEGVEQVELLAPSSPIVTPSFPNVSYFVPATLNVVLL